nr:5882_t:CDS:2 [Entrophospora candida]
MDNKNLMPQTEEIRELDTEDLQTKKENNKEFILNNPDKYLVDVYGNFCHTDPEMMESEYYYIYKSSVHKYEKVIESIATIIINEKDNEGNRLSENDVNQGEIQMAERRPLLATLLMFRNGGINPNVNNEDERIICLVCRNKWYQQNYQPKIEEKSKTSKKQLISIKKENCSSLMSMNYENNSKYLLGIRQQSALEKDSVPQETVDLIITSPPYNVSIDYGSNGLEIDQEYIKNSMVRIEKECSFDISEVSDKKNIGLEDSNAKVSFVPNATYDIVLYTAESYPITLSIKTSLRERYKQADLEGLALKNVHRRAKNYLITMSAKEYEGVKRKIQEGDVAGLDKIILADSKEFDNLITELSQMSFVKPEAMAVIKGKVVE